MGTTVIGLTGGIGMGKSTAASILREIGVGVLDTDDVARELVEPGSEALARLAASFGPGILDSVGVLNRRALGDLVFRDPTKRAELESILHPPIQRRWSDQVAAWRVDGVPVGCVVIPLLFEKEYARAFDAVVAVGCSRPTRRERVRERGWDDAELGRREAAQWEPERKMALADHVVWTEGSVGVHRRQWERILSGRSTT